VSSHEARCFCGAVRLVAELPPKWCANCHCTMCRRAHAAPVVTWAGFDMAKVRITAGEDALRHHASSPEAKRSFCGQCGTQMSFVSTLWPGEVHIARACFADDAPFKPSVEVHFSDRAPWQPQSDVLPKRGGETGMERL